MNKLLLPVILIVLLPGSLSDRRCSCQTALESDVAHGANELQEYSETTVKRIRGQIVYWNGEKPVKDVVVEIYEIPPADRKLKVSDITKRRKRTAACITSDDGSFCFSNLPSGRYLVRAGVRSAHDGMNDVFIKVNVDRAWWSRWFRRDKQIKLGLTPGT